MIESPVPRSPLAALDLAARTAPAPDAGALLRELPFLGKLNLRGNPEDAAFVNRSWEALQLELPLTPNRVAWRDDITVLWLGPDEWLIVMPRADDVHMLAERLREGLRGQHVAITDVSSGRTVIRLAGPHARDVLYKGCSLDFDPPAFDIGHCAQSRLGNASVIIHQVEPGPGEGPFAYDLYVARSYALSFWKWLKDAGLEYGVAATAV